MRPVSFWLPELRWRAAGARATAFRRSGGAAGDASEQRVPLQLPAADPVSDFLAIQGGETRCLRGFTALWERACYKGVCGGCVSRVKVRRPGLPPCPQAKGATRHVGRRAAASSPPPDVLGFLLSCVLRLENLPFLPPCRWPTLRGSRGRTDGGTADGQRFTVCVEAREPRASLRRLGSWQNRRNQQRQSCCSPPSLSEPGYRQRCTSLRVGPLLDAVGGEVPARSPGGGGKPVAGGFWESSC